MLSTVDNNKKLKKMKKSKKTQKIKRNLRHIEFDCCLMSHLNTQRSSVSLSLPLFLFFPHSLTLYLPLFPLSLPLSFLLPRKLNQ